MQDKFGLIHHIALTATFARVKLLQTAFTLAAILCIQNQLFTQNANAFEMSYGVGKIVKIYNNFPDRKAHQQLSLCYSWKGRSIYSEKYKNPDNQIVLSLHDFGNRAVLGNGVGLQYRLRLNKHFQKLQLFSTFGFGGIYCTKPYHYINNTENKVLGASVSALISVETGFSYKLNKHILIGAKLSFWHSSNMHTVLPNVGLNSPMANISARYEFKPMRKSKDRIVEPIENAIEYNFRTAWGRNEAGTTARPTNGPKYNKYVGVIGLSYRFRTIHRVSVDLEGYYDETYRLFNELSPSILKNPTIHSSALMLMFGHEFIHGNFGLVTHIGFNIYNPTLRYLNKEVNGDGSFNMGLIMPIRVAARYYILKPENTKTSPYIQFGVKSNFGLADYLELGIGVLISKRQD